MQNILLLAKNTLYVTFRKKSNIVVLLLLPVVSTLLVISLYGSVGNSNVKVGVVDYDNSVISKNYFSMFKDQNGYKLSAENVSEGNNKVSAGNLDCLVIIPKDFEKSISNGTKKDIEIVSVKGQQVTAYISNITNIYTRNLLDAGRASKGDKKLFYEIVKSFSINKTSISVNTLKDRTANRLMTVSNMGFLVFFMMLGAGFTADLILKEKKNKTFFRICTAPVSPWKYIAGNAVANFVIVTLQTLLVLVAMKQIFHIETFIPFYQMLILLLCFGFVAIGLGMLIVSFSKDSVQAGTMNTLIVSPSCMLGGCYWDVNMMPENIKKIANFMPQKWIMEAITVLQTGKGLAGIAMHISIILGFALVFFLVAIYRFKSSDRVGSFV